MDKDEKFFICNCGKFYLEYKPKGFCINCIEFLCEACIESKFKKIGNIGNHNCDYKEDNFPFYELLLKRSDIRFKLKSKYDEVESLYNQIINIYNDIHSELKENLKRFCDSFKNEETISRVGRYQMEETLNQYLSCIHFSMELQKRIPNELAKIVNELKELEDNYKGFLKDSKQIISNLIQEFKKVSIPSENLESNNKSSNQDNKQQYDGKIVSRPPKYGFINKFLTNKHDK